MPDFEPGTADGVVGPRKSARVSARAASAAISPHIASRYKDVDSETIESPSKPAKTAKSSEFTGIKISFKNNPTKRKLREQRSEVQLEAEKPNKRHNPDKEVMTSYVRTRRKERINYKEDNDEETEDERSDEGDPNVKTFPTPKSLLTKRLPKEDLTVPKFKLGSALDVPSSGLGISKRGTKRRTPEYEAAMILMKMSRDVPSQP